MNGSERGLCPDFLVIGAMKSGTTTLYEDLRRHPRLRLLDKESAVLAGAAEGMSPTGDPVRSYAETIRRRDQNVTIGEVATTYAMRPHFPNVAETAQKVLPAATKIIYIVRNPVDRIISHHHHDMSSGRVSAGIDDAVREDPRFLDYSRYAAQITPWIDGFGRRQILVLRFEDYVADRVSGMTRTYEFLGVDAPRNLLDADHLVHNSSDRKPVAVGRWSKLVRSPLYRRILRPLVPEPLRRRVTTSVLPKAPPRPLPPRPDTVRFIQHELAEDQARFAAIVGSGWWPATERPRPQDPGT